MTEKIVTMDLPVKLTDEELLKYTKELVDLLAERRATESEKKATMSKYKEQLDSMDVDISEVASKLRSGEEKRPVECWEEPNFAEKVVEVFRRDTGERVHARSMTDEDHQLSIARIAVTEDGIEV
jgi:vacuolar-type H+-ATPase subunit I/STV1